MTLDVSRLVAALTVWMEARGEGDAGMRAVAWCLVNRHTAGKWFSGKTLAECCLIPFAFSCWNTRDPNRIAAARLAGDEDILSDIDGHLADALAGDGDDPTGGATHYIDTSIPTPDWAQSAILAASIGRLKFYRNVN